jgi:hypothetical protein
LLANQRSSKTISDPRAAGGAADHGVGAELVQREDVGPMGHLMGEARVSRAVAGDMQDLVTGEIAPGHLHRPPRSAHRFRVRAVKAG